MRWRLLVRPEAEADLADGFQWYEGESEGLGVEFVEAVEKVFAFIGSNPLQYPKIHSEVRRALAKRFPYAVFFIAEAGVAAVIAVTHQSRDPERWRERL